MKHHLHKTFTEKEMLFIEIMVSRKKSVQFIAKELGAWYYRVRMVVDKIKKENDRRNQRTK